MEISEKTVRELEALAALRLSDADRERMRVHLGRILSYMKQLEELDVTDVPPTCHVVESQNVLRADEVRPSMLPELVLRNASDTKDHFYRVPRFLGDEEAPA